MEELMDVVCEDYMLEPMATVVVDALPYLMLIRDSHTGQIAFYFKPDPWHIKPLTTNGTFSVDGSTAAITINLANRSITNNSENKRVIAIRGFNF